MKSYYKQIKILAAIGLVLIAAVFIVIALTPLSGRMVFKNESVTARQSFSKVNINTAPADELALLPSLGEKRAEAIVEYREEHGKFKTAEEIKNVKGIGESIFEEIKDKITV